MDTGANAREPSYAELLGRTLREKDPVALQRFLLRKAREFGDATQADDLDDKSYNEMEELMHRMILARPDLQDLHRESREWLFKRGIDTFGTGGGRRN